MVELLSNSRFSHLNIQIWSSPSYYHFTSFRYSSFGINRLHEVYTNLLEPFILSFYPLPLLGPGDKSSTCLRRESLMKAIRVMFFKKMQRMKIFENFEILSKFVFHYIILHHFCFSLL